jgi:hypothetical protein
MLDRLYCAPLDSNGLESFRNSLVRLVGHSRPGPQMLFLVTGLAKGLLDSHSVAATPATPG